MCCSISLHSPPLAPCTAWNASSGAPQGKQEPQSWIFHHSNNSWSQQSTLKVLQSCYLKRTDWFNSLSKQYAAYGSQAEHRCNQEFQVSCSPIFLLFCEKWNNCTLLLLKAISRRCKPALQLSKEFEWVLDQLDELQSCIRFKSIPFQQST